MNNVNNPNSEVTEVGGRKLSIEEYLDQDEKKDLLRLLTAGSVDDGKSTLIGRLLFDSKKLYEDQLAALERDSKRVGNAGEHIDYALLCDGLKAEREQGITIDVAYRYFSTNKRKFIIADTPGHEQYTRNMITGGSTANLAVILVDARTGVITQTRRHTFLVSLLGIKHIVLAVNKMDLVDYDRAVFDKIVSDFRAFIAPFNIPDVQCIPLSALEGDNVVTHSDRTPWYDGPSILQFLEEVSIGNDHNLRDFRFPVQYVLRPNLDFRGFCGKVASGIVRRGDRIMALPSGKTSRVKRIVTYDGDIDLAFPPQSVTLQLEDEIDISRGEMIVKCPDPLPDNLANITSLPEGPFIGRHFETMLVWMDEEAMDTAKSFYLKHTTNTTRCRVDHIKYKVDVNTLEQSQVDRLALNEIGRAVIVTSKELFFDAYQDNKPTGAFVLIDPITNNTSAVGMIIGPVAEQELHTDDALPTLDLPALGIAPEHYDAIDTAVRALQKQGLAIVVKK
ncbi:MAG: sulfate adenylyltransferase subunit CysN [Bacteroidales bacterium]|nr:sulfate adenylyltransferase subunit CysN [Bacteroidales bacterium]